MMGLVSFVLLVSLGGSLCVRISSDECKSQTEEKCDRSLYPTDFPDDIEELKTICENMQTLFNCVIDAGESCDENEELLHEYRESLNFIKSACDEDSDIFKAISGNLQCISQNIAGKFGRRCYKISDEVEEKIDSHVSPFYENYNEEVAECLNAGLERSCPAITLGYHCGLEVKDAAGEIMSYLNYPLHPCKVEHLEMLRPVFQSFEEIVLEGLKLQDELENRK